MNLNSTFSQLSVSFHSIIFSSFYCILLFLLISSFTIYQIYKPKKWIVYISIQCLIFGAYLGYDFMSVTSLVSAIIKNFLQALIVITTVLYLILLIYDYLPYSKKRYLIWHEYKIYLGLTLIGLFLFSLNHYHNLTYSIVIKSITFSLLFITQYLMFALKRNNRQYTYLAVILLSPVFFSLCFMSINTQSITLHSINNDILMKALCLISFIIGINTNYRLIKRKEKINKANEINTYQYILLLKNYHRLLLNEKEAKAEQIASEKTALNSLKEHIHHLGEYLKIEYKLTEREVDVIFLIWDGKTNKEIASILNITLSTTKYHVSNIFIKFDVNSRSQIFALKDW